MADPDMLMQVSDIGPIISSVLVSILCRIHNLGSHRSVGFAGVTWSERSDSTACSKGRWQEKVCVLTGTLASLSRDEATAIIEASGAGSAVRSRKRRIT